MECENVLTRIDALRTREIAPRECDAVESHIGDCASCRESAADIVQFADALRTLSTPTSDIAGSSGRPRR